LIAKDYHIFLPQRPSSQATAVVATFSSLGPVSCPEREARSALQQDVSNPTLLLTSTIRTPTASTSTDKMKHSAVLLLFYWRRASLPFALFYAIFSLTLMVSAENCGKPFSMPVTNVALNNGNHMRGVQIAIGSSEQPLAMVPSLYVDSNLDNDLADVSQAHQQYSYLRQPGAMRQELHPG